MVAAGFASDRWKSLEEARKGGLALRRYPLDVRGRVELSDSVCRPRFCEPAFDGAFRRGRNRHVDKLDLFTPRGRELESFSGGFGRNGGDWLRVCDFGNQERERERLGGCS